MSQWGGGVPWWRVVHADGSFLAGSECEALSHYRRERTPLRIGSDGRPSRLDMRAARWPGGDHAHGDHEHADDAHGDHEHSERHITPERPGK
jgi:hypothetical protein